MSSCLRQDWEAGTHRVRGELLIRERFRGFRDLATIARRDLAVLLLHMLATIARLAGLGGVRAVVDESVLVLCKSLTSIRRDDVPLAEKAVNAYALSRAMRKPGRRLRGLPVVEVEELRSDSRHRMARANGALTMPTLSHT